MSWKVFTNLVVTAVVEVSEPDAGRVNYLFLFKQDGIPTHLETAGDWGVIKEGSLVKLEVKQYRCQLGRSLVPGYGGYEFPVRSQICSAETDQVLINGKPNPKK